MQRDGKVKMTKAQIDLLRDLAADNPEPTECWICWDPPPSKPTVTALVRKGMIEAREDEEIRFTAAGRRALAEAEGKQP